MLELFGQQIDVMMRPHGVYIWAAYGFAFVLMAGVAGQSLASFKAQKRRLKARLQALKSENEAK